LHPLLDPSARPVVGHRGNAIAAPENTIESFRQAAVLGVDAIEFDVRLSADGEVVVMHDPTVDRTTGHSGAVSAMTVTELRAIGVPTLVEVLETFPAMPFLIELKVAAVGAPVRRILERLGATGRCLVAAFDRRAIAPFAGSSIVWGASVPDVRVLLPGAVLGRRYRALPYRFMSVPRWFRGIRLPIGALVRAVAPAGCLVHVWTVNDAAIARELWALGVQGIISDDPKTILAARDG
jgi:glycerophosphoryl diester phosphodiesterase